MTFDDLDTRMRRYETAHDWSVLPGIFIVVRLDGRGFTRLTKSTHSFQTPFDERFRDHMISTLHRLMNCGFRVVFGYTQSDEISLLLHLEDQTFGRKIGKINSVLAGEASSAFSLSLGAAGVFDSRVSQLPHGRLVIEYFRWRQQDAGRNALHAHCYWLLRKQGDSSTQATQKLAGLPFSAKQEFLFNKGINFNDLPNWQKRGCAVYWEAYEKSGLNPMTGEHVKTERHRLHTDLNLPLGSGFETLITHQLTHAGGWKTDPWRPAIMTQFRLNYQPIKPSKSRFRFADKLLQNSPQRTQGVIGDSCYNRGDRRLFVLSCITSFSGCPICQPLH